MVTQKDVTVLLSEAYDKLKISELSSSIQILDTALSADFENEEVLFVLTCLKWWQERFSRTEQMQSTFEKAEYIMSQWKSYQSFLRRSSGKFEPARYSIKCFIFRSALLWYQTALCSEYGDTETTLKLGRCHKGMGEYNNAVEKLQIAYNFRIDDPETLAELADTYALINEIRLSKALFREAFFLNAQKINLVFLESALIEKLIGFVSSLGYENQELSEWIPVYGTILGIFNIKRELKSAEISKLKQSIYELENEVKENEEQRNILVPRLLNKYFWLIDHMVKIREDRTRVDEILLKIRLLDPAIHQKYIS